MYHVGKIFVLLSLVYFAYVHTTVCKDGGGDNVAVDAFASVTDNDSNVYVVGSLTTFQFGLYNNYTVTIAGKVFGGEAEGGINSVGYIAKFNPRNSHTVFVQVMKLLNYSEDNQSSATIKSIVYKNRNLYIAGEVFGTVNAFGCMLAANIYNGGAFVAKLDLSGKCLKSTVIDTYFTPYLLADSTTNHLYVSGLVYTAASFGPYSFPKPGGSALFIAKMSFLKSYDWIVRITNQDAYVSVTTDIGQDGAYVYSLIQASGNLTACDMHMNCFDTVLATPNKELIKVAKSTGRVTFSNLEKNVSSYNAQNIGVSVGGSRTNFYVAEIDRNAYVSKYNDRGVMQWRVPIPNNCCDNYRNMQAYTVGIRFDSSGDVYVGGVTNMGSGSRFALGQPFVAKINESGGLKFNTRADVTTIEALPSRYTYAGGIAFNDEDGEVYLVGGYGCTLKFGNKNLTTPDNNCAFGPPNGRNTYMYIISADAHSGAPCS